jgi:hypothetical protein
MITNKASCTREIKLRIIMAKEALTCKLDLNLGKKLVKYYIWSIIFYVTEIWILLKVDQKYLQSFEIGRWRRTEIY